MKLKKSAIETYSLSEKGYADERLSPVQVTVYVVKKFKGVVFAYTSHNSQDSVYSGVRVMYNTQPYLTDTLNLYYICISNLYFVNEFVIRSHK